MRIAISGTHRVGKTTLAEALADALEGYELVPEPYHLLEEEGYECEEMPSLEDFERQLERSMQAIAESDENAIFDRCPLDVLGYLVTHREAAAFDVEEWLPRVREAMQKIDLVVFVPIEEPDLVPVPRAEARLRARVDEALCELVVDDAHALERPFIAVAGTVTQRVNQVTARL